MGKWASVEKNQGAFGLGLGRKFFAIKIDRFTLLVALL
jgi:hypothetical protein